MKPSKSWTSLEAYFPRAEGRLLASCYRPGLMVLDRRTKSGKLVAGFCLGRSDELEWCQKPDGLYWVMIFWPQIWGEMGAPVATSWDRWGPAKHFKWERVLAAGQLRTHLSWIRDMYATFAHKKLK